MHSSLKLPGFPIYAELPWFAIKVRVKSESGAITALREQGFDCFFPSRRERRTYCDREKVVECAVFPGYIFCRFDPERKLRILNTRGVNYIVGFGGGMTPIADAELDAVRRAVAAGALPVPYLNVGQQVRIQHGPLAGIEGILTRSCGASRVVVSIELLQRSVAVNIHENEVSAEFTPLVSPGSQPTVAYD